MRLTFKIGSIIFLIVIFAVSLMVALSYFKFESFLEDMTRSRFAIIVKDVRNTVQNGLNLGLSLQELQTTQQVIDTIKNQDNKILSINVFEITLNNQTKSLFNTRRVGIGGAIPLLWMKVIETTPLSEPWYINAKDTSVIGIVLVNSSNLPIGGVAVRYSRSSIIDQSLSFLKHLTSQISFFILGILIAIYISTYLFLLPILKSIKKVTKTLKSNNKKLSIHPTNDLEDELITSLTVMKKAQQEIKKLEKKLNHV